MSRKSTYTRLALLDLLRLWRSTQHHVIIVSGICLPLFLLLGIKNGFIEDMRAELLASPQGRQITFWAMDSADYLVQGQVETLGEDIGGIEIVIPDTQRLVTFHSKAEAKSLDATVYPTREGDPLLTFSKVAIPRENALEVIFDRNLADSLGCSVGDVVQLELSRKTDAGQETNRIDGVKVIAIIESGDKSSNVAYCHLNLIDNIELYVQGFESPLLGLPGVNDRYRPDFRGYLLVARDPLSQDDDIQPLNDSGMKVTKIGSSVNEDLEQGVDKSQRALILSFIRSVFKESSSQPKLEYYLITSQGKKGQALRFGAVQIANKTQIDDVIVPLTNPVFLEHDESRKILIGADMPRSTWLRNYLPRKGVAFRSPFVINQGRLFEQVNAKEQKSFALRISNDISLPITVVSDDDLSRFDSPPDPVNLDSEDYPVFDMQETIDSAFEASAEVVCVPSELLESIYLHRSGELGYDQQHNIFVQIQPQLTYGRARLYCDSIDEVPSVSNEMVERGYAVLSEMERISEIHATNDSLGLLVMIVGVGVIGFGVFTVVSVLSDSTDRKRGTIGVLRVMGVSRMGVFYIVTLRAAVIGIASGLLAIGVGYGISLSIQSHIAVTFDLSQIAIVLSGALFCSGFGAIVPAFKASRLDPFEAILEGQFS